MINQYNYALYKKFERIRIEDPFYEMLFCSHLDSTLFYVANVMSVLRELQCTEELEEEEFIEGYWAVMYCFGNDPFCYCVGLELARYNVSGDVSDNGMRTRFNSTNSLAITRNNFNQLMKQWPHILRTLPEFVVWWQDKAGWVRMEPFNDEQAVNQRIHEIKSM